MRKLIYLVFAASFVTSSVNAQPIKRRHARSKDVPPSAVFVQLPTGSNKIKYLESLSRQRKKELKEVKEQWATVRAKTILDFSDHFDYCPVYYFYDTNLVYITHQQFEGRLLDKDLKPVANGTIKQNDTTYFLLAYGFADDAEEFKDKNMIASDWRGKQLKHPLPYRSFSEYSPINKERYFFRSRRNNIEYEGYAMPYNETLAVYYRSKN